MDTIQINKFSKLHDDEKIIFCKTDFLIEEFERIKNMKNDIILISGNSDYVIDEYIYEKKPKNIKKWFAQNAMFQNDVLECIPLGIENLNNCYRFGHGIGYTRVLIKESLIQNRNFSNPQKFIYANFNVDTNPEHRTIVRDICQETFHINWEEPNLTLDLFFERISEHEAVICAQGNGPGDNHRIYETLYMDRIPITFNKVMYDNLHHLFPVVLIENYHELKDLDGINDKIQKVKNKKWDKSILSMDFWLKKISEKL